MFRSALFLLLFFASVQLLMAQSRALPIEAEPISGDILQTDVWDFSQQWIRNDRGRAAVVVYGDSLVAETLDGRRFWYTCAGDSVRFCGEEDRLTAIDLDAPAFVHPRPLSPGLTNGTVCFTASGTGGGKMFDISETGTIEFSSSTKRGRLILAPGDTLTNVLAVRERHFVTASFPTDSAGVATLMMTETLRWYDADGTASLMPLAIQRSTYYPHVASDPVPLTATAYLPERGDFSIAKSDGDDPNSEVPDVDAVNAALQHATIVCDGRSVTVTASMPQVGITLTVDIVDAAGHLYLHESFISTGTTDEATVDCTGLRQGEYIAVVGAEDIPANPKKHIVIIR